MNLARDMVAASIMEKGGKFKKQQSMGNEFFKV